MPGSPVPSTGRNDSLEMFRMDCTPIRISPYSVPCRVLCYEIAAAESHDPLQYQDLRIDPLKDRLINRGIFDVVSQVLSYQDEDSPYPVVIIDEVDLINAISIYRSRGLQSIRITILSWEELS